MINQIGNYSLYISLFASIYLIFQSSILIRNNFKYIDSKIFSVLSVQLLMVLISFFSLILGFVNSDFSNETVYNNSHSTKPLFYKISGSWGNHEGSLLLWLLVLVIFLFIFLINSKKLSTKYRLLTVLFQEIIIIGFLFFILFTSNPFLNIFPVPKEGMGLNPILQDPALAIHPPILYFGYVGTSIIFSSSLSALICGSINKIWAEHIKKWIIISWVLLSIGIVLLDHYKIQSKPTYWSFDRWITGLYELMSSLPKFILLIALVVFFEPGWLGYILILASVTWIQKSRMIRAEVLKCKEELFIESAKALGLKDHIIIFRHIFSNIFNTIAVTWIYHLGNLFLLDASLNFIGMSGLSQHTSWGYLLAQYRYDLSAWWILLFPALGLVLFVLPLFSLSKYISQKEIENHI